MSSEQATKKQKVVDGSAKPTFTMQADLVAAAEEYVKGPNKMTQVISYMEATKLWESALDGPGVTDNEFKTLQHILDTFAFTDKARRYLTALATKQTSGKSTYKTINKVRYDRSALDLADHLNKDGKLDLGDAKQLWEDVEDGPGVTLTERRTVEYILSNYTVTDGGRAFLEKHMQEKMGLKLMYFDGRGLMEVPRQLLATVNKFAPTDYEDFRFKNFEAFGAAQKTGELGPANMNRVPLIEHFGNRIGQGGAINRYLANAYGLMGSNAVEAAKIDNICEHVNEIGTAFGKVYPYGNDFSDEKQETIRSKWFEATVAQGDATRSDRALAWHLSHLEKSVGDGGHAFGDKPSLADALIYNRLGDVAANLGAKGGPFGTEVKRTDKVLESYPKVRKIVDTFAASQGMVKYLAARGDQTF